MLALAERLPKDRFAVEILDLIGDGPLDDRATAAGVRIQPLGRGRVGDAGLVRMVVGRTRKMAAYVRTARAQRYDIVDAWLYPEDLVAASLRVLTRTPIVISGRRNMAPRGWAGPQICSSNRCSTD